MKEDWNKVGKEVNAVTTETENLYDCVTEVKNERCDPRRVVLAFHKHKWVVDACKSLHKYIDLPADTRALACIRCRLIS